MADRSSGARGHVRDGRPVPASGPRTWRCRRGARPSPATATGGRPGWTPRAGCPHVPTPPWPPWPSGEHFGIGRARRGGGGRPGGRDPGRLRPLAGRDGSLLLDDTYNAAPRSVLAGLDTLASLPGWAAHRGARRHDRARGGQRGAAPTGREAGGRGGGPPGDPGHVGGVDGGRRGQGRASIAERVAITFTPEDAAAEASRRLGPGAVVLIKGSAAARMERVVERLLAEGVRPRRPAGAPGSGLEVPEHRPARPADVVGDRPVGRDPQRPAPGGPGTGGRGHGGAEGRRLRARRRTGGPHRAPQRGDPSGGRLPSRGAGAPRRPASGPRSSSSGTHRDGRHARRSDSPSPWPCSTTTRPGRSGWRPGRSIPPCRCT